MPQTKRLPVPHRGGALSSRYSSTPKSWSDSIRRDLRAITTWLMAVGVHGVTGYGEKIRRVDCVTQGFRCGSQIMMLVAGTGCTCGDLPHGSSCGVWRKAEIREHMWSCYGITASTKTPPEGYLEDVINFPHAG
jgi:hypothetical protein